MKLVVWTVAMICIVPGCAAVQGPEPAVTENPCTLPQGVSPYSLEALELMQQCRDGHK